MDHRRSKLAHGYSKLRFILVCLLILCSLAVLAAERVTILEDDERVVLFPGFCYSPDGGHRWIVQVTGCVLEPGDAITRIKVLQRLLWSYGINLNATESQTFNKRAQLFMSDSKSGVRVFVRCAGKVYDMGKTGANGHFTGQIPLDEASEKKLGLDRTNRFYVSAALSENRAQVRTEISVLSAAGLIVVSDIDDTIKLSMVTHPQMMLQNTFIENFKPIKGMNTLYEGWAKEANARFFYYSGSPWQLYEPLSAFVRMEKFPQGVFCLKQFRFKDKSAFSFLHNQEDYKISGIDELMKKFGHNPFVLVGDSGEKDPEAYGTLARRYPKQVARILIRNVTGEPPSAERYRRAFAGVPRSKWTVFRDPSTLTNALPVLAQ